MRGNAQPDGRSLGGTELWSFFSLWTKVCQIKFVWEYRSLQRHFPIDDVLLCSRDTRDQVTKLSRIGSKF